MIAWQNHMRASWQSWTARLECASPSCAASRRLWRRAAHRGVASVRLHERRYCFPQCFESALKERFVLLLQTPVITTRRPHRIPLGLLLLSRGEIDGGQLLAALAEQRSQGRGRIGEWIEYLGFAQEPQITAALAAQWACPVLPRVPWQRLDIALPLALLRRFGMAPVHYAAGTRIMHVAFAEHIDYSALLAIEQVLECQVQPCIVASSVLESLLAHAEDAPRRLDQFFDVTRTPAEMARIASGYAGTFSAEKVRLARCAEFVWARMMAKGEVANLLFPAQGN